MPGQSSPAGQNPLAGGIDPMDAGAVSTLRVAQAVQKRQEAGAAVKQAEAGLTQARASRRQAGAGVTAAQSAWQQAQAAERQATFAVQGAEGNVPAVQAQLDDARFHLAPCKVLAPADGYVVNWQVQEGPMLVSVPLAPAGTFLSTAETAIVAAFPPNYLMNVGPGDEVELVLDPYPGRLFQGKVDTVITASGPGQFTVSGNTPDAAKVGSPGVYAVTIQLTDGTRASDLPPGAGGAVAIYTDRGKPVHVISKVAIRMKKGLLYVLPTVKKP